MPVSGYHGYSGRNFKTLYDIEAAKDILDLMIFNLPKELLSPYSPLVLQMFSKGVEIYDICERCLPPFPQDSKDQVICSTVGFEWVCM